MEIGYQMLFESERNLGSWTGNKGKKKPRFFSPNLRSVSPHLNFACYLTFVSPFLYLMYLGLHNKFTSSCKILWLFRHVLAISLASLGAENQISFRYEIPLWIEVQRCFSPEPWITNIGIYFFMLPTMPETGRLIWKKPNWDKGCMFFFN